MSLTKDCQKLIKSIFILFMDETSSKMDYVCPDNHNLESWGDANPSNGEYTLMQPTINPLFNGRQFQDSLLTWLGSSETYYDILKNSYSSWEEKLHDGYFTGVKVDYSLNSKFSAPSFSITSSKGIEFEISEKISMGDGTQSNNPWLQELPDPLSRASWDNYLTMSASTARDLGVKNWNVSNGALNGSLVNITVGDKSLKNVPVMIQPGQAIGTVALSVGYGRTHAGKCGDGVGHNAYPLLNGGIAEITVVEGIHEFAAVQLHHTMMGREIVKETTLADFINDPSSGNHREKYYTHDGPKTSDQVTLGMNMIMKQVISGICLLIYHFVQDVLCSFVS